MRAQQACGCGDVAPRFGKRLLDVLPLHARQRNHRALRLRSTGGIVEQRPDDGISGHRFHQVVMCATLDRLHGSGDAGITRDQQNAHVIADCLQRRDEVESRLLGEFQVDQCELRAMQPRQLQRLGNILGNQGIQTPLAQ
jgi:hypothetical protein